MDFINNPPPMDNVIELNDLKPIYDYFNTLKTEIEALKRRVTELENSGDN